MAARLRFRRVRSFTLQPDASSVALHAATLQSLEPCTRRSPFKAGTPSEVGGPHCSALSQPRRGSFVIPEPSQPVSTETKACQGPPPSSCPSVLPIPSTRCFVFTVLLSSLPPLFLQMLWKERSPVFQGQLFPATWTRQAAPCPLHPFLPRVQDPGPTVSGREAVTQRLKSVEHRAFVDCTQFHAACLAAPLVLNPSLACWGPSPISLG